MTLEKEKVENIIKKFGKHEKDTGSTEAQIAKVIKEDWFTLSSNAKNAVRHYVDTWDIDKNLFFKKKQ